MTHRGTANADGVDEIQTADTDGTSHRRRRRSRYLTETQQMQMERTKHRQQTQIERAMEDADGANELLMYSKLRRHR